MENEEPKKKKKVVLVVGTGGVASVAMEMIARLEKEHEIVVVEAANELKDFRKKEVVIPIRNLICEIPVNNYDYSLHKKSEDEILKRQNKLREKHFNKNCTKR